MSRTIYERDFMKDLRGIDDRLKVKPTYDDDGLPTTAGLEERVLELPIMHKLIEGFMDLPESEGNDMLHRVTMAAYWKEFGCPVFNITPELAAALIMTELPDGPDEKVPFPAFIVSIQVRPDEPTPLVIDGADYYGFSFYGQADAWCLWAFPRWTDQHCHYEKMPVERTIKEWTELHPQSIHIHRLLSNFFSYLVAKKDEGTLPKTKVVRMGSRKGSRVCSLGREVQLPQHLIYAARGEGGAKDGFKINKRYVVRGHWRNQRYGPRNNNKIRRILIMPFWKGPDVLEAAERVYKVK